MLRRQRHYTVEREGQLRVHRVRDPGGAVLIEGGDTILRRYEARVRSVRGRTDKVQDRLLRRTVLPGRERVGPGMQDAEGQQRCEVEFQANPTHEIRDAPYRPSGFL